MSKIRVVILTGHSLFADGAASRMRQHARDVEIRVIDPATGDVLHMLREFKPAAAILDAQDPELRKSLPIQDLLRTVPDLRVILLDSQQEDLQILTGEYRRAGKMEDLLDLILESKDDHRVNG